MNLCAVGNSLVTLMCHLFNVYGLIHHFQLDMVKLHRFLGKLYWSVTIPLNLCWQLKKKPCPKISSRLQTILWRPGHNKLTVRNVGKVEEGPKPSPSWCVPRCRHCHTSQNIFLPIQYVKLPSDLLVKEITNECIREMEVRKKQMKKSHKQTLNICQLHSKETFWKLSRNMTIWSEDTEDRLISFIVRGHLSTTWQKNVTSLSHYLPCVIKYLFSIETLW